MPRKRFKNEQIAFVLRLAGNGATVDEVSLWTSPATTATSKPPAGARAAGSQAFSGHSW